jgi:uncharacterized protein (DUF58 family)
VLAACLAHVVLAQRDAVALNIFDTKVRERFARTDNPGKIHEIMQRLAAVEPVQETRLGRAIQDLAAVVKSRSIIIIISDLMDDEEGFKKGIDRLRFQGSEVIVFQVLDPYELEFPFTGTVKFVGLEGAPELQTSPASIRKSYLKEFDDFRNRIVRICEQADSHYVLANTAVSVGEMLGQYLAFRRNYRTR